METYDQLIRKKIHLKKIMNYNLQFTIYNTKVNWKMS